MSILVFDWGGTSVKHGIWTEETLKNLGSFPTPQTWNELKSSMKKIFKQYEGIKGIAISSPGSVDVSTGIIGGISAIEYIHHFEIEKELELLFKLPVSIENDANAAALAEVWKGAAKGFENVLFVVVGTGIGGAIVMDGEIKRGRNLFGGEFGCMILDGKQSFSILGTAVHMAERYSERMGHEKTKFSGTEVFERAKKNDPLAREEVNNFYDALSLGLYNLQFTTDPEVILIGGGISQNEVIITTLNNRIKERLIENGLEDVIVEVRPCTFKNDANLIGAVAAFMTKHHKI